jgi:hypothetical protein
MAIAHVQDLAATASNPTMSLQSSTAFGTTPVTGNTILVYVWHYNSFSVSSVTDNVAGSPNTYVKDAASIFTGTKPGCDVWRCAGITGGAGLKVTANLTGSSYCTLSASEFSGILTVSPLDGAGATNNGTTANPTTGVFSTTNANDLLLVSIASTDFASGTVTEPTGFTRCASEQSTGTFIDGDTGYQIVSSTQSSINPAWTIAAPHTWASCALAYKAAAGGGTTYTLSAAPGSFTLSGQAATLSVQRKLAAAAGSFTLAGQSASLSIQRRLTAGAGSFALTGDSATLSVGRRLTTGAGTFTLAGAAASLSIQRRLPAAAGSFALTGQPASMHVGRVLSAGAGAFTLTGQPAALSIQRRLTAGAGVFTLTGMAATLTATGKASYMLAAGAGSFVLTGCAASLVVARGLAPAAKPPTIADRVSIDYTQADRVSVTYTIADRASIDYTQADRVEFGTAARS